MINDIFPSLHFMLIFAPSSASGLFAPMCCDKKWPCTSPQKAGAKQDEVPPHRGLLPCSLPLSPLCRPHLAMISMYTSTHTSIQCIRWQLFTPQASVFSTKKGADSILFSISNIIQPLHREYLHFTSEPWKVWNLANKPQNRTFYYCR